MTQIDDTTSETVEPTAPEHDRRAMLRKVAIGGAGAAIAVTALGKTAEAADGDPINAGETTASTVPTQLTNDPAAAVTAGPSSFSVSNAAVGATAPFPANVGGYGNAKVANGLHGSTSQAGGFGVVAANTAPAVDETTTPVPNAPAALAVASANGPQIKFVALGEGVVGPTAGTHVPGELYVDKDGTLWFTVPVPAVAPATTPGVRFIKLAGTPTAGSLHTLPFPVRVSDSRLGTNPVKPAANSINTVDLTKKVDATASGLPAGATAALLNLTIANSDNKGFFSVAAAGVTTPAAALFSNGNWTQAGTNLGTSVTTAISSDGKITITLGPEGGTHLIVDVVGYYL
jgi:hypothetical protein